MNAVFFRRVLLFSLLSFGGLFLGVDSLSAAETGSSMLQANFVWEFAGDRSRMIQMSLVFVLLGCAMLWWKR